MKGKAKSAEMWVDRDPCKACGIDNGIGSIARELGVEEIIVHSTSGISNFLPPKVKHIMNEFEVHIDKWEGSVDKGTSLIINKTNASDIESYLNFLDGRVHTQLLIIPLDRKSSLLIGGGNNKNYVVTYTLGNDEEFYNLTNPMKAGEKEIELVTGGQAGSFSDKYCVDFNSLLAAAIHYIQFEERNPKLNWERQT